VVEGGKAVSLGECSVAVWVFALLSLLAFGMAQQGIRLTDLAAMREQAYMLAEGHLERDCRLLARGQVPPSEVVEQIDQLNYITSEQTVRASVYLDRVSVTVQTLAARPVVVPVQLVVLQAIPSA